MSKDILSEYGPESPERQAPRATISGHTTAKEMPYFPPVGPTNINDPKKPGINGTIHPHGSQHCK